MNDHDQLFKKLLKAYFAEFIELFFPRLHRKIDWTSLQFIDKEIFSGRPKSARRSVDLLVKVKFLNKEEAFFLIHLEHQAQPQAKFGKRMFEYFCYLTANYPIPVYPIALFSFPAPLRPEPTSYKVKVGDSRIVNFRYKVVQLNRLNWRDFIRSENPIASALMAKMRFDVADRPLVKLQCLRLFATLRLDEDKQSVITEFINTYLKLTAAETRALVREMQTIEPEEAKSVQKATSEFFDMGLRKGKREGKRQGKLEGIKIGEQQGKLETQLKTVINMHAQKLPLETIALVTELEPAEVERLIAKASQP
jgi:predicted transposase YdaD